MSENDEFLERIAEYDKKIRAMVDLANEMDAAEKASFWERIREIDQQAKRRLEELKAGITQQPS